MLDFRYGGRSFHRQSPNTQRTRIRKDMNVYIYIYKYMNALPSLDLVKLRYFNRFGLKLPPYLRMSAPRTTSQLLVFRLSSVSSHPSCQEYQLKVAKAMQIIFVLGAVSGNTAPGRKQKPND